MLVFVLNQSFKLMPMPKKKKPIFYLNALRGKLIRDHTIYGKIQVRTL